MTEKCDVITFIRFFLRTKMIWMAQLWHLAIQLTKLQHIVAHWLKCDTLDFVLDFKFTERKITIKLQSPHSHSHTQGKARHESIVCCGTTTAATSESLRFCLHRFFHVSPLQLELEREKSWQRINSAEVFRILCVHSVYSTTLTKWRAISDGLLVECSVPCNGSHLQSLLCGYGIW